MVRSLEAAALCALALMLAAAAPAAGAPAPAGARAVIVFLPQVEPPPLPVNPTDAQRQALRDSNERNDLTRTLARRPDLAMGLMGATQGAYSQQQALLDMTQGTRVSFSTYSPEDLPTLALARAGTGARFTGWRVVARRGASAPADIVPGLLAGSIPGGMGYAGVLGVPHLEALAAADPRGHVAQVSLGPEATLPARVGALLRTHRAVVAGLLPGAPGARTLDALRAARRPGELLLVIRTPPERRSPQLLATGLAVTGRPGALTSTTTRQPGLVAGIDVLPTVLDHLGIAVPGKVKGRPIREEGTRDPAALRDFDSRSRVVGPRRLPAIETALFAWLAVLLVLGVFDPRGGVRRGLRVGGLGLFWVPSLLLATAAIEPARSAELYLITGSALALAFLTDRLVPWPRGLALPAAVSLLAYTIDLALGSPLTIRSLLGPNPRFGSRFYGIGNELEAMLPVLLFAGVAAARPALRRAREGMLAFGAAGLALGIVVGSGRLGADVGGVITVGAGTAAAMVAMAPGGVTRRSVGLAVVVPVAAVAALALLDLATGGDSHFTRTVLDAGSTGDLWDIVRRRYELAYKNLIKGLTPELTAMALLAIVYAVRNRAALFSTVRESPAWHAALVAGVASSLAGALFNDSGPVLLLYGTVLLVFVTAYLRGDPRLVARPPASGERPRRRSRTAQKPPPPARETAPLTASD